MVVEISFSESLDQAEPIWLVSGSLKHPALKGWGRGLKAC